MARTPPKPRTDRIDPAGMDWRDGKPIWIPAPGLRRAGWKSIALREPHPEGKGAYLPRGLARIMARDILADVERWRDGQPTRKFHPGAAHAILPATAGQKTLNAAWDRWQVHPSYLRLAKKTRATYRNDLRRFLAAAGGLHPCDVDRAALRAWFEAEWDRLYAIKALDWTEEKWAAAKRVLDPDGAAFVPDARAARWAALDDNRRKANTPGQAQMNACVRAISAFYKFINVELGRDWVPEAYNPAREFGLIGLKPRLRLPSYAELAHLVATAEGMDYFVVADLLVLLANMGPRIADACNVPMSVFAEGRLQVTVQKTGAKLDVKFPAVFWRRMSEIQLRRAQREAALKNPHGEEGAQDQKGPHPEERAQPASRRARALPPNLLLTDAKAQPLTPDHADTLFADVRDAAAKAMPSVADLTLYDFRKFAITRLSAAGNTRDAISAVTSHSHQTVDTILDHYVIPNREAADAAIDRLDAHLKATGAKY